MKLKHLARVMRPWLSTGRSATRLSWSACISERGRGVRVRSASRSVGSIIDGEYLKPLFHYLTLLFTFPSGAICGAFHAPRPPGEPPLQQHAEAAAQPEQCHPQAVEGSTPGSGVWERALGWQVLILTSLLYIQIETMAGLGSITNVFCNY